jgi:heme exporter protein CcmD
LGKKYVTSGDKVMLQKINSFLAMGGYALFVWSAYGVVLVTLTVMAIRYHIAAKRLTKELQAFYKG